MHPDSVTHLIHRAGQAATAAFMRADTGLHPTAWCVLAALGRSAGSLTQVQITAATGIDRSTMTDVTKSLASRGLISRRRDRSDAGDARTQICRITAAGRTLLQAKTPAVRAAEDELLRTFGSDDELALRAHLEAIANEIGAKADGKRGRHRTATAHASSAGAPWAPEAPTKTESATP